MTKTPIYSLKQLGWKPFFQQQIQLDELQTCEPARVSQAHRSHLILCNQHGQLQVPVTSSESIATGDWVLVENAQRVTRVLERATDIQRRAAGVTNVEQSIVANVDYVLIVTSMNDEFNLNRIERYLALATGAGAQPLLCLTKADLSETPDIFTDNVRAAFPGIQWFCFGRDDARTLDALKSICSEGSTSVLVGSSGVGKSTLLNKLLAKETQLTSAIREKDSKGRHTTTSRSMHFIPVGGILLDTPGIRELQLFQSKNGIDEVFADVLALAQHCRFSDCQHESEPGCAVLAALETNQLDERHLKNYKKLLKEDARLNQSLVEKHQGERSFAKVIKQTMKHKRKNREGR